MVLYKRCPHRDTRSAAKRIRIAIVEGSKFRHSSAAQPNAARTHTQARDVSSSCPRRSCARARVQDQNAVRVTSRHALTMTCSVCEITTRNPYNCGFASRAAQNCDAGSPGLPLNMLKEITSHQHGFGEVCHLCKFTPGDPKPLQTHCPKFLKNPTLVRFENNQECDVGLSSKWRANFPEKSGYFSPCACRME